MQVRIRPGVKRPSWKLESPIRSDRATRTMLVRWTVFASVSRRPDRRNREAKNPKYVIPPVRAASAIPKIHSPAPRLNRVQRIPVTAPKRRAAMTERKRGLLRSRGMPSQRSLTPSVQASTAIQLKLSAKSPNRLYPTTDPASADRAVLPGSAIAAAIPKGRIPPGSSSTAARIPTGKERSTARSSFPSRVWLKSVFQPFDSLFPSCALNILHHPFHVFFSMLPRER